MASTRTSGLSASVASVWFCVVAGAPARPPGNGAGEGARRHTEAKTGGRGRPPPRGGGGGGGGGAPAATQKKRRAGEGARRHTEAAQTGLAAPSAVAQNLHFTANKTV